MKIKMNDEYRDKHENSGNESEEFNEDIEEDLEDFEEEIEDLEDEYEETIEDLDDEQERLDEEKEKIEEALEEEKERIQEDLEKIYEKLDRRAEKAEYKSEKARGKLEKEKERLERERERLDREKERADERIARAQERINEAKERVKNAKEEYVRMNISLPKHMKKEWKDLAGQINTSVSQLIRSAVKKVGPVLENVKSIQDLEKIGDYFDEWGEQIEAAVEGSVDKSGIEDLGRDIEKKIKAGMKGKKYTYKRKYGEESQTETKPSVDKERMKKRVKGLIKLQNALPIDKLAQILEIKEEDAENLIYELAAEGIEGSLEEDVFKFEGDSDELIELLHKKIEAM